MIVSFSFRNFRSYKNETEFDFQAASIPEFEDSLIVRENVSPLLPVGVIYGPNGGGKSGVLLALGCLVSFVVSPIVRLEKTRVSVIQQSVGFQPFLLDDKSKSSPTVFDLFFRTEKNEFRYYLSVSDDVIVEECLYKKTYAGKRTAMIFERDGDTVTLGASIKAKSINTEVNPKMPYLSFLAINYNLPVIAEVQSWFESCIFINYANPKFEGKMLITRDIEEKKAIIGLMNEMGVDITDFRFDEEQKKLLLEKTVNGKTYEMDYHFESEGTKKLFVLLPYILLALKEGRLAIIDELDAKLHPKLLRYVISLFKVPTINRYGAQLLFTSHDLTTMNRFVFRRDEIWFAALNQNRESEIYSLFDFRNDDGTHVANTASYGKQYMEGKYGADPYLRNILEWEG